MPRNPRPRIPIDPIAFGNLLREVRQERGLSQDDLGYAMSSLWRSHGLPGKISVGWVKQIERGDLKSVDRMRIACAAEVLQVPVTRLLPAVEEGAPASDIEVAMTLRSYGLSHEDIDKLLAEIKTLAPNGTLKTLYRKERKSPHKDPAD